MNAFIVNANITKALLYYFIEKVVKPNIHSKSEALNRLMNEH